ncbi:MULTISPECIES: aldehyde dehydrogenase family protein [Dictyoglomus]|uniref:Aldehyde Dehydrogenase n=1 Tax=Dictyoglomus turgidum (strain DSM 6724 / Z-1310) TaxID=515635 RepID=B8E1Z9_DICTD|nr:MULTISPECIES: aldehyde dehydrogenase family protein [Dictyoglomus]ACK41782.1 Aldehyde Dehydrogenase [Dictyoglomus turgidum DSM 6724]HBU31373.1 aldehyde dehydrogenase [Dictyoglomus sp.]
MVKTINVYNPYDGTIVETIPESTLEDVDRAIEKAEKGKKIMAEMSLFERSEILRKTAEIIEKNKEDFASTLVKEVGKTIKEARIEVRRAVEIFKLASEEAKRIHGETLPFDSIPNGEKRVGYFIRVPVGIIAAITPFNVPLVLASHKIAPAIAGGNSIVFKPSTITPLADIKLAKALIEAGLPEEAINVVVGPGSTVGNAIVKDPRIRMISFTGSKDVGMEILKNAGLKKISLELGSNSALILSKNGDISSAVSATIKGGYAVAGQVCISVQRVFVQKEIYDEYLEKLIEGVRNIKVGDPMKEDTDMGPVISEESAKRIEEWIKEAVDMGAKVVFGGKREKTLFEPTVVINVPTEAKLFSKEVFGPVVVVNSFNKLSEAIEMANNSEYGLQAGIFTNDIEEAFYAIKKLEVGGVMINDAPSYRADFMPYGGVKGSGIGREGVKYALEEMTEIKTVCFNLRGGVE